MQQQLEGLDKTIATARDRIAGGSDSLVQPITEFEALTLQREFAERGLASAVSFLDTARLSAQRQQLYLDEVVHPNEADYAKYPRRFADLGIVFATLFGLYTIFKLIAAGAREHRTM